MTANNLVVDPAQLSAALGKYITGTYIDPSSAAYSLVQQAISVQDYPPIAGANGYPPAINTHPATTTPPVTTPGTPTPPKPPPPKALPKRRYVVVTAFTTKNPPWNSTLSGIAGRSHRTVSQLASWNGISNPNVITTGKHIWIDPTSGYSGSIEWKG
jgi:LysM repeat protein